MRQDALFRRYEPFVAAAILGAHANTLDNGFRQTNVRLLLEMFTNWIAHAEENSALPFQNNQIARYIGELVDDGFARIISRGGHPLYRLTRAGLVELITRVASRERFNPREHFFFVLSFVNSYRQRIIELVQKEGTRFPYSLQLEVEKLLDVRNLLERQIAEATQELQKLEQRIEGALALRALTTTLQDYELDYQSILQEIDRRMPFSFNTQRRLTDVFRHATDKQGLWELQIGNTNRVEQLWKPSMTILKAYLAELDVHLKRVTTIQNAS